ncbi:hypothetical protein NL676_005154 [Syzygium grande]|nr:hypothetical protein NL676_005154 [Syzygium grande]
MRYSSQLPLTPTSGDEEGEEEVPLREANLLRRDSDRRHQASGSWVQQQNVIDQQKQSYPSQTPLSETSMMSIDTGHPAGGDWQEEAYQKMKSMREAYLPELNDMYQKISMKIQQSSAFPAQAASISQLMLEKPRSLLVKVWLPAMAIVGLVVVGSGYTRPAMDPANAFGWAYMNNWHNMGEQFEYWISQFASAVLEGWAFKLLLKPRIRDEI